MLRGHLTPTNKQQVYAPYSRRALSQAMFVIFVVAQNMGIFRIIFEFQGNMALQFTRTHTPSYYCRLWRRGICSTCRSHVSVNNT